MGTNQEDRTKLVEDEQKERGKKKRVDREKKLGKIQKDELEEVE